MANSKIDICNHALLKVGADIIASTDTAQTNDKAAVRAATACDLLYDQALEEVLRLYPWNSCTTRVVPTLLQDAPTYRYQYAHQIPNDCLRVLSISDNERDIDDNLRWALEEDRILSDYSVIYLKYTKRPESVRILDPLCVSAVICNLAIKLAPALQLDDSYVTKLTSELYQVILPNARSIDTFENKEFIDEQSSWINARSYDSPCSY